MEVNGIVAAIFAVFTAIGNWIVEALNDLTPMFYSAETGLTFLGTLSIIGLGFAVIFLIIGIIQRFLNFRGN